jgi:phosphoglycolate phosphatase-like HAD superfamily hydrolase
VRRKTIGFDFDQTLADSKLGITSCLEAVCQKYGLKEKENEIEALSTSGLTLEAILEQLFKTSEIGIQKKDFLRIYPELGVRGTKLLPGARELLDYVRSEGHHLVLISAKTQINLQLSVDALGVKFDKVFGGVGGSDKSSVITQNGVEVYIGDQISDVVAANLANVKAVLISDSPIAVDKGRYPHFHFRTLKDLQESFKTLLKT